MTENEIQKATKDQLNAIPGCTIYRNNTGAAKMGRRWVKFGLCKGSSDLIGYTETEITADMVGKKVAIFTAFEIKKPGGKVTIEQIEFGDKVRNSGGIFAVVDEPSQAIDAIEKGLE